MTMADIATRVESLTGACRETDADIFKAIGMPLPHEFMSRGIGLSWDARQGAFVMPLDEKMQIRFDHPAFTGSIDAAVALLPKASLWSVCDMEDGPYAQVIRPMPSGGYINGLTTGNAITPALALCAAALRALALTGNEQTCEGK